jgi:hypothetical protein
MTILVDGPVSSEALSEVGVQADLIPPASPSAKCHRAQHTGCLFCHKRKIGARPICNHCGLRTFVRPRLANNEAKSSG